jgi:large subunit ribosomal protein L17
LTKSKTDSTHSRRIVFSYLKNKEAVTELFREVSPKIADRPGGYTRIIRLGFRQGDNAEMAMIELVDFNEIYGKEADMAAAKKRTRRGGAKKKEDEGTVEASATEGAEGATEEKPKAKRAPRKKKDDSAAE